MTLDEAAAYALEGADPITSDAATRRRIGPMTAEPFHLDVPPIALVDDAERRPDRRRRRIPALLMLTCANCGATMDERKCKLICRCGYFLSCSDYY